MTGWVDAIWQTVAGAVGVLFLSIVVLIIVFVWRGIYEVAKTGSWNK